LALVIDLTTSANLLVGEDWTRNDGVAGNADVVSCPSGTNTVIVVDGGRGVVREMEKGATLCKERILPIMSSIQDNVQAEFIRHCTLQL
jgi:hypothetical protein